MASLSHAQKVTRLYRKSLKHMLSWTVDRGLWRQQAVELRSRFDANKDIKDMNKAVRLLQEGEEEFNYLKHPDPYICECILQTHIPNASLNYTPGDTYGTILESITSVEWVIYLRLF